MPDLQTVIPLGDALRIARLAATKFSQRLPQSSHDDVLSIALEAGWRASERWDPRKSAIPGGAYVRIAVDRALIGWWRQETGHRWTGGKKVRPPVLLSLNREIKQHGGADSSTSNHMTLQDTVADRRASVTIRLDMLEELRQMPPRQRTIVLRRMLGDPQATIAADLGITESRVCQITNECKPRLMAIAA